MPARPDGTEYYLLRPDTDPDADAAEPLTDKQLDQLQDEILELEAEVAAAQTQLDDANERYEAAQKLRRHRDYEAAWADPEPAELADL